MASIIKVQNLRKVYRVGKEKVVALDDICLEIGEGEMCCIVGASGQRQIHTAQPACRAGKAHQRQGADWQA